MRLKIERLILDIPGASPYQARQLAERVARRLGELPQTAPKKQDAPAGTMQIELDALRPLSMNALADQIADRIRKELS